MARIFIAGATGLTGRAAVAHGCAAGHEVVAHVRPDSSKLGVWRERFEGLGAEVDATAWDEAAMTETLSARAPDAVLALLGTTRKRAKGEGRSAVDAYEAIDYGLSALLRRAAEASGCAPRYVYLSSLGVKDGTSNPYLNARARIERELREGSIPWVVARPSFIIGDRDEHRAGESIGAAIGDGALGLIGALGGKKLRDKYASMTGDQLGAAMVVLAVEDGVVGEIVETDRLRALAG